MSSYVVEVLIERPRGVRRHAQAELLRQAAERTLQLHHDAGPCELVVVVAGDATLRELNQRHRGVDAVTDVLAFPNAASGPFVDAPGLPRYLGDVIVSLPRARAQASEVGNELNAELQLLVVHGVLHLLGYDDQTEGERATMWRAQQEVLDDLRVVVPLPD